MGQKSATKLFYMDSRIKKKWWSLALRSLSFPFRSHYQKDLQIEDKLKFITNQKKPHHNKIDKQ